MNQHSKEGNCLVKYNTGKSTIKIEFTIQFYQTIWSMQHVYIYTYMAYIVAFKNLKKREIQRSICRVLTQASIHKYSWTNKPATCSSCCLLSEPDKPEPDKFDDPGSPLTATFW